MGDVFVFLDLRADRYFLLHGDAARRFERFLAGTLSAADADWLSERRIISPAFAAQEPARSAPTVRSSIFDVEMPAACLRDTAAAIGAQIRARYELRSRSLGRIIKSIDHPEILSRTLAPEGYRAAAAAFRRARHFFPAIDECLPRGIAMKRLLCRQRREAALVIGVTLPFSAHCWVQAGDVVLTDPIDVVLPFEPILVV